MKRGFVTMKQVRMFLLSLAMVFAVILAWPSKALADVWKDQINRLYLSGNVTKEEVQAYAGDSYVFSVTALEGTVLPEDCDYLFKDFQSPTYDLTKADFSKVKSMNYMFSNCTRLASLDLSNCKLTNVEGMQGTFFKCMFLTDLKLEGLLRQS